MSSYYIPLGNQSLDGLPGTVNLLGRAGEKAAQANRAGSLERILGTTVAMLNQAQSELEVSKRQVEDLKRQLADLERVATTDLLTGLKNRRGFEDCFNRELDRVKRGKSVGGVLVIIDLDSFKAINDTYGHQAGDACLKLVGDVLTEEIREMDIGSRLGGDEFVLLLTDTNPDELLGRVQNIAWRLNHLHLDWEGTDIAISASVGMKPFRKGDKAAAIFAGADANMYDDKKRIKECH